MDTDPDLTFYVYYSQSKENTCIDSLNRLNVEKIL
jgi:hypothetical protein